MNAEMRIRAERLLRDLRAGCFHRISLERLVCASRTAWTMPNAHSRSPSAIPPGSVPTSPCLPGWRDEHEAIPPFVLLRRSWRARRARRGARSRSSGRHYRRSRSCGRASFAEDLPVLPVPVAGTVVGGPARPGRGRPRCSSRSSRRCARHGRRRRAPWSPTRSARPCSIARGFAFPGHTEYLAALAADGGQTSASGDDACRWPSWRRAGHHPHSAEGGPRRS